MKEKYLKPESKVFDVKLEGRVLDGSIPIGEGEGGGDF